MTRLTPEAEQAIRIRAQLIVSADYKSAHSRNMWADRAALLEELDALRAERDNWHDQCSAAQIAEIDMAKKLDKAEAELAQARRRNEQHTAAYHEVPSHNAEIAMLLADVDAVLHYWSSDNLDSDVSDLQKLHETTIAATARHRARQSKPSETKPEPEGQAT